MNDIRRAWLGEDEDGLSAARVAKHRLADEVRRLIDATFQLDVGDVDYREVERLDAGFIAAAVNREATHGLGQRDNRADAVDREATRGLGHGEASDADFLAETAQDTALRTEIQALAAQAAALADRINALPRIPRATADGLNSSQARRLDALLVERSTINGRANPLSPPVRMWADGDLIRAEAFFTAPYEGPPGRVHGAWVAACFDEILGCAQGASGAFGFTGTLTVTMRRATPLYTKITYEAGFSHREGRKLHGWGRCYADGTLTAEASGIFVVPVWADAAS